PPLDNPREAARVILRWARRQRWKRHRRPPAGHLDRTWLQWYGGKTVSVSVHRTEIRLRVWVEDRPVISAVVRDLGQLLDLLAVLRITPWHWSPLWRDGHATGALLSEEVMAA